MGRPKRRVMSKRSGNTRSSNNGGGVCENPIRTAMHDWKTHDVREASWACAYRGSPDDVNVCVCVCAYFLRNWPSFRVGTLDGKRSSSVHNDNVICTFWTPVFRIWAGNRRLSPDTRKGGRESQRVVRPCRCHANGSSNAERRRT